MPTLNAQTGITLVIADETIHRIRGFLLTT
jgi:hypothetical protein